MTMNVGGLEIKVRGRFPRTAGVAADTYEFVEDPAHILNALRSANERVDLFTFMQRLPDTSPKYQYSMEWDNLAVLPISSFEHWWTKQVNDKTRNMARRAGKKGVVFRQATPDDELVQGVWAIYNECEIRQGKKFPHYGKDLKTVQSETLTFLDRSVFFGAYFQDQLIGFAKLHCHAARTQAGIVSILSLTEHRDKSPTNALIAEAVRYCAANRIPNLVYSRYSDGNKERDSLMDFKDHNGFQKVLLPRYFVPLTPLGQMALQVGLHKRLVDHVPDFIMSKVRLVRKNWYMRRMETAQ